MSYKKYPVESNIRCIFHPDTYTCNSNVANNGDLIGLIEADLSTNIVTKCLLATSVAIIVCLTNKSCV